MISATLAERMWRRLCVCVCVCVCFSSLLWLSVFVFFSGVFLLSRGDNLHSLFKMMMRKYSSRFATFLYIYKYPLILLPTVWSLEQWSCCGFLALRLSLQVVNFLCFCYEVVAFVVEIAIIFGVFLFVVLWDAFSEQRTLVLVSSFVIACVIDMTFIPAWKFFFS
jgi:hypothetical protein